MVENRKNNRISFEYVLAYFLLFGAFCLFCLGIANRIVNSYILPPRIEQAKNIAYECGFSLGKAEAEAVCNKKMKELATLSEQMRKSEVHFYADKIMRYNKNLPRDLVLNEVAFMQKKSHETKIPLAITIGIVITESRGDPYAVSNANALGLCQIRYCVHSKALKEAGIMNERRDCFDYKKSITAMYYILQQAQKAAEKAGRNDWITIFEIYNKGYYGAKKNNFRCTEYSRKVLLVD